MARGVAFLADSYLEAGLAGFGRDFFRLKKKKKKKKLRERE